jgi:hypothetical protein
MTYGLTGPPTILQEVMSCGPGSTAESLAIPGPYHREEGLLLGERFRVPFMPVEADCPDLTTTTL